MGSITHLAFISRLVIVRHLVLAIHIGTNNLVVIHFLVRRSVLLLLSFIVERNSTLTIGFHRATFWGVLRSTTRRPIAGQMLILHVRSILRLVGKTIRGWGGSIRRLGGVRSTHGGSRIWPIGRMRRSMTRIGWSILIVGQYHVRGKGKRFSGVCGLVHGGGILRRVVGSGGRIGSGG